MQTVKIKEREDNLTNYCPSCGVCNSDGDFGLVMLR